jgi:hypothetical protein
LSGLLLLFAREALCGPARLFFLLRFLRVRHGLSLYFGSG